MESSARRRTTHATSWKTGLHEDQRVLGVGCGEPSAQRPLLAARPCRTPRSATSSPVQPPLPPRVLEKHSQDPVPALSSQACRACSSFLRMRCASPPDLPVSQPTHLGPFGMPRAMWPLGGFRTGCYLCRCFSRPPDLVSASCRSLDSPYGTQVLLAEGSFGELTFAVTRSPRRCVCPLGVFLPR